MFLSTTISKSTLPLPFILKISICFPDFRTDKLVIFHIKNCLISIQNCFLCYLIEYRFILFYKISSFSSLEKKSAKVHLWLLIQICTVNNYNALKIQWWTYSTLNLGTVEIYIIQKNVFKIDWTLARSIYLTYILLYLHVLNSHHVKLLWIQNTYVIVGYWSSVALK